MTAPASLLLDRLVKHFGAQAAVTDVSLDIAPGEMIVLLGPSGCGKTTTLRMIAGFVQPSSGDIRLDGRSILPLPAHRREMGVVFQSYALFPHLTVARNVAFGLEMRRMAAPAAAARVQEMLRLVKLEAFAARLPRHLSGGQQQRVALARALAIHPRLLLLDEPLSNLDAALRLEMAREIRLLQRARGVTTVMVTHDQAEAMALADRIVVMRDGRTQQVARTEELYEHPANPFVAGFIGGSNILAGRLDAHRFVPDGGSPITLAARYAESGPATLAIRPESIRLEPCDNAQPGARAAGMVELCTNLGVTVEHVVRLGNGTTMVARSPGLGPDAAARYAPGTSVTLRWRAAEERLFDTDDGPLQPTARMDAKQGEQEWAS